METVISGTNHTASVGGDDDEEEVCPDAEFDDSDAREGSVLAQSDEDVRRVANAGVVMWVLGVLCCCCMEGEV